MVQVHPPPLACSDSQCEPGQTGSMVSTIQQRLLERVRLDLGDLPQPFDFQFVGDGIRDHFNIEHRPFDESSVVLLSYDTPVDPFVEGVTLDGLTGTVVFQIPPEAGSRWEVQGQKWRYFSDDDLRIFLDTSVAQHGHHRADSSGGMYNMNDIPPVEEYPVALYAVIQALWALATDAAFDIDIMAPDGVNIPRSERFRQLTEMIGARQHQYDELAAALNIGINAVEVFTVRRTAKLTNRLVPVYLPAEFDDRSRAKRVLFPPLLIGTAPIKTSLGTYDWEITSGDPISRVFDFEFDLTDCVITNAIRSGATPGGGGTVGPPLMQFTQEVVDAANGQIRLSLTGSETRRLQYNSYWEIQVALPGQEALTKMRGLVRATNNEVVR